MAGKKFSEEQRHVLHTFFPFLTTPVTTELRGLAKQKPRNKEELSFMVATIWRQINKAECVKLIDTMPDRAHLSLARASLPGICLEIQQLTACSGFRTISALVFETKTTGPSAQN
ncbi:hypothetical protein J6590_086468 [Homalodisca vitripennis]|nr:hypothetical protein J6590_086468 [Homalodisca vitripennis]